MPARAPRALLVLATSLVLAFVAPACSDSLNNGSSGATPSTLVDISGEWTGTFESDDASHSGTVTVQFEQDEDGTVTGTSDFVALVGSPTCWTTGPIANARVEGRVFTGDILRVPSEDPPLVNGRVITSSFDVLVDDIVGTYTAQILPAEETMAAGCTALETGTIQLNR